MWRALGLAAVCFVVLLSHAYLRPYADRYYGWAERLFLCWIQACSAWLGTCSLLPGMEVAMPLWFLGGRRGKGNEAGNHFRPVTLMFEQEDGV